MTIKSKPYYWFECDHKGCAGRSPSLGWEIDAWSDEEGALAGADGDDWTVTDAGEHYCPDHRPDEDDDPAERDDTARDDDAIDRADTERKERDR